jgi:hypothetical protein
MRIWTCDTCHLPVAAGDGFVHIDAAAARHAHLARVERARTPRMTLDLVVDGAVEHWKTHHHACDPEPESPDYFIPVGDLLDPVGLDDWTAHLAQKPWVRDATDWFTLIQS